jgi:hypothetical protein
MAAAINRRDISDTCIFPDTDNAVEVPLPARRARRSLNEETFGGLSIGFRVLFPGRADRRSFETDSPSLMDVFINKIFEEHVSLDRRRALT